MAGKPKCTEYPPSIRWLEDAAEAHYFREAIGLVDAAYQPLAGWLYLAAARMVRKGDLLKQIKQRAGIDPKTLSKGLPKRASTSALMNKRINEDLQRRYRLENQRFVVNVKRVVTLTNQASAEHPDGIPCIAFLGELGALAGDDFSRLCHGVDEFSKAMLYKRLSRQQAGGGLPALAASCGFIANRQAVPACKTLDPGLDAMLMLLAALDCAIMREAAEGPIWSIFRLLFRQDARPTDNPVRRLLDVFFGVAVYLTTKTKPERLPTIEALDRILLDPALDTDIEDRKQRIVRWRRGDQKLWRRDVEQMVEWVNQQSRQDVSLLFICLYLACQCWSALRACPDFHQDTVLDRYMCWWHAMAPAGACPVRSEGYWALMG